MTKNFEDTMKDGFDLSNFGNLSDDEWSERNRKAAEFDRYIEEMQREPDDRFFPRIRLPKHLQAMAFKSYDWSRNAEMNAGEYARIRKYVESFSEDGIAKRGWLLMGDVGVGKTHLCTCMFTMFARRSFSAIYVTQAELLRSITMLTSYSDDHIIYDRACRDRVLIIDDFGFGIGDNETHLAHMLHLFECRYGKLTFLTSNMSSPDLIASAGAQIADRIKQLCNMATLSGKSGRK